jgi:hypothetical protein
MPVPQKVSFLLNSGYYYLFVLPSSINAKSGKKSIYPRPIGQEDASQGTNAIG